MTLAEIKSELEKAYNEEDWNRIETLIDNLEIAIQIDGDEIFEWEDDHDEID
jgi:enolase